MVDDALQPEATGSVKQEYLGERPSSHSKLERLAADIERHGEVHATFEHTDAEVECRLGTTKLNPDAGMVEVFGGDQWHPFDAEHLVTWEVPMDLFH